MVSLTLCLLIVSLGTQAFSIGDILALNVSFGGRLERGIPFSRPCFSTGSNVIGQNAEQCRDVISGYFDHNVRLEAFGSYMNTEWETCQSTGDGCILDVSNTTTLGVCHQGSVPPVYLEIETAKDVQTAFAFARTSGASIVIKNTGHDFIGRSAGPGTLALWTHGLQTVKYIERFVATGCHSIPVAAVTIGAGVTHGTLYEFAERMNISLPGGADTTVGAAGGYLQGGGHSAVSNAYGLAADRALEFEVVTPDGRHLVANACQNTDLFFGLRGGGGGTFGVVLHATIKALPQFSMTTAFVTFDPKKSSEVLAFMVHNAISYAEQGEFFCWSGIIVPAQKITLTSPLHNIENAASFLHPLKMLMEDIGGTFELSSERSWLSFFNRFLAHNSIPVGLPFVTSSRLISASIFSTSDRRAELLHGLNKVFETNGTKPIIFMVAPYYFEDEGGTSVSDAWRTSLWHVTSSVILPGAGVISVYRKLTKAMDVLREISPSSGAYVNEADVFEPNFEESFWGANYGRLVAIKRKYDPHHLLDCWHCVDWKGINDPRYSCYPRIS